MGKKKCLDWFKRHKPDNVDQMVAKVEEYMETDQWQDTSLIPHPSTWLNRGSWDDELDDGNTNAAAWARIDAKREARDERN